MSSVRLSINLFKITGYLLNVNHPRGGPKAKFFMAHGFSLANPIMLASALLDHGVQNWPGNLIPSTYGERHEIIAPFSCPDGTVRDMLTVWEIPHNANEAGFVTAYPW